MNRPKKRRCGYVTEKQKSVLIAFMRTHPELQAGRFSATFTFKVAQVLWEEISETLHGIAGAVKSWQQWRKTWQDIRCKVKTKSREIRRHKRATGGGPASSQQLTQLEESVASMIDTTAIEGHQDWSDNAGASERTRTTENDDDFLASEYVKVEVREADTIHGTKRATRQTALNTSTTAEPTDVTNKDQAIREQYYKRKLELYERQVVAQEQFVAEVKEIKQIVQEAFQYLE